MSEMSDTRDDMDQTRGPAYIGERDAGEAARLAAQEPGGLEELSAALALHPPPPDARVLELGCGSGVFTRALLTALPGATVTATDRDEALLESARASLTDEIHAGRVSLARADATGLPFPARGYDLVACRCLLMHQPDPLVVAAEMFRVAAVGGVALAIEPDWGARALYPDAEALAALLEMARRARPFGFPDLTLGRKLFALFRAAGFVRIRVQPTAFTETAVDRDPPSDVDALTGPGRLLEQGRKPLRQSGAASDDEIGELIARFTAIQHHPEYFSAGVDFAAVAIKPAPDWPA